MNHQALSIRPFIGAKNFDLSRRFYRDLGFQESILSPDMSFFHAEGFGFYLQNAYVKDWIDNTMIFLEVTDVKRHWEQLITLDLPTRYTGVRVSPVQTLEWGKEYFLHDPSGILWHFGEFAR